MTLTFDEKFDERSSKEQIAYLKKLCDSQNTALDMMQKERNSWMDRARSYEDAAKQAEEAFYIQKNIVKNLLNKTNADDQQTHDRIRDLEKMVGELGGDFN